MGTKTDKATRARLHDEAASLSLLESPLQHRHLHEWVRAHVPREPDFVVVDVGDHEGELACVVAPDVRRVTIVGSSTELAAAELRVDADGLGNVVFKPGEASALPFADGSFDLVLCGLRVDLLDHPQRQVSELARVCRQGGSILVIGVALPEPPGASGERAGAASRAASAPPVGKLVALLERAGTTVVQRSEHDESPEIAARLKRIGTARSFAERMRLHFTVRWTAVLAQKRGDELPPAGLA